MIRAVIFDLDGVLVSTDRLHFRAWKALADRLGIPFDEQINQRLRGVSRMASLEIILESGMRQVSDVEKAALAAEKNTAYRTLLAAMTPDDLCPDTRAALDTLRERGILLAVGSGSQNAPAILKRVGLGDFFDAVVDGTLLSHPKPHPEVFQKAAALLRVLPAQAVVVEDAAAGIEAAKAGGFPAVGMGAGTGAAVTIERLSELVDILSRFEG